MVKGWGCNEGTKNHRRRAKKRGIRVGLKGKDRESNEDMHRQRERWWETRRPESGRSFQSFTEALESSHCV